MHNWIGLWKFWFQPGSWVEYYPVQETVRWVQWQLWSNDTLGYHLTNVVLHFINALLVWHLFSKFDLRLAWLGGFIFAIHPAQVESVAWISELKNTLSLPFFLLAICFWIDYEASHSKRDYGKALGLFFVAMLCKATMALFPVIILLYAWWKRGRIQWSDLKAGTPFLIVSLVLGLTLIWVGRLYSGIGHEQPENIPLGGIFSRFDGAGHIMSVYFFRVFLPVDSLLIYPKWQVNPCSWFEYLPWLVLAGLFVVLWRKRQSWGRHALLGLGFFLINLIPFLGFNAISYMSFTWVMDHFLYIPIIGLIGLVIAGLGDLETRVSARLCPYSCSLGGLTVVLALLAWESHFLAGLFVNDETFWTYMLERNPNAWLAHHNLGLDLLDKERIPEAIAQFNEVLRLNPGFSDGHYNMGIALDKTGQTTEAQNQYRQALTLDPDNEQACLNLGVIEKRSGNLTDAEDLFTRALKLNPNDAVASLDLGDILLQTGRLSQAIDLFKQAVELNPDVAQLHYNLGNALLESGQFSLAVEQFGTAVALDPDFAPAHENLGVALARSGRILEAIEQFQVALQINPAYAAARDNLGLALAQTGRIPEAVEQFQLALRSNPNDANARQCLVKLRALSSGIPAKP